MLIKPLVTTDLGCRPLKCTRGWRLGTTCPEFPVVLLDCTPYKTVWPSGLRRWLKAPVRKGVGSNPTAVTRLCRAASTRRWHSLPDTQKIQFLVRESLFQRLLGDPMEPPGRFPSQVCASVQQGTRGRTRTHPPRPGRGVAHPLRLAASPKHPQCHFTLHLVTMHTRARGKQHAKAQQKLGE